MGLELLWRGIAYRTDAAGRVESVDLREHALQGEAPIAVAVPPRPVSHSR
jgi:hypothetical protein